MLNNYRVNVEVFKNNNYLELPFDVINESNIRTNLGFVWFVQVEGDEIKAYIIDSASFSEDIFDVYFSMNTPVRKYSDKFYIHVPDVFGELFMDEDMIYGMLSEDIEYYRLGEQTSLNYYTENYLNDSVPLFYNNLHNLTNNGFTLKSSLIDLLNLRDENFLILSLYEEDYEYFAVYTRFNEYVNFDSLNLADRICVKIYYFEGQPTVGLPVPKQIYNTLGLNDENTVSFSCYLNNNMFFFKIGKMV